MQKIIMSILLMTIASVPITAHAITVTINGTTYDCQSASATCSPDGTTIQVIHDQTGDGFQCFSATDPAAFDPTAQPTVGAIFQLVQSGDIADMVMSDVLCRNISGSPSLNISFSNQFDVTGIDSRWYFISVQGSFFNIFGGPAQVTESLGASASVIFFNNGGNASDPVSIGSTGGSFTDAFGPQNPLQIVNLIDCTWNNCDTSEIVIPVLSTSLAQGDGIYLFGSQHTGSAPTAAQAAAYLTSLTAKIDVLNNNTVGVSDKGNVLLDLFGASNVYTGAGQVDFNVRNVDFKSVQLGPPGGSTVGPNGPTTFKDDNGDGILDVRLRFPNALPNGQPVWNCSDKVAVLTGQINIGGTTFPFTATANIIPSPCP
jgi:hypothetical protein